jgi:hypothetical protein
LLLFFIFGGLENDTLITFPQNSELSMFSIACSQSSGSSNSMWAKPFACSSLLIKYGGNYK